MSAVYYDYAIIGNSTGAVGCIEAIRERTSDGSIAVISAETHHVYGRPVISYYLAGETTDRSLKYRPDNFYEKNGVTLFLGRTVTSLDGSQKQLTLDNGEALGYGKLLISVGGAPIVPPIPGRDLQGVFQFNTLDDVNAIGAALAEGIRAVVIGGGLTGLKAAEALTMRGAQVTVVEMMDRVMGQATDLRTSRLVKSLFTEQDCEFRLGVTAEEILGTDGRVTGVRLASGETLPCEMVILAIGIRPRLELAEAAGIETGRGIQVDSHMCTSFPDIYACGDVAEAYDFLTRSNRVLPLLPNAYVGGRVAGANMAGDDKVYRWGTSANSVDFFGFPMASAGKLEADGGDECLVYDDGDREYRKIILTGNRLAGFLYAGKVDRIGILFGHMRAGTDLTRGRDHLLDMPVSSIFLPELKKPGTQNQST